jgi:secondary thiamine-phosphate synthase enzyme
MTLIQKSIDVQSEGLHPSFHDITDQVRSITAESGIKAGICVVYSHHTTCSVMIQECSHDKTYFGLEYLQQDLCNLMEKLIPTCRVEGQYLHPGPKHVEFGESVGESGPWTSLNTDGHLRSCLFGRSETIIVEDGKPDLGEFGHIYLIDWDQVRARKRTVKITLLGD